MATQEAKILIQENDQIRELTGDELKAFLAQKQADEAELELLAAAEDAMKARKAEILDRLGITAEEAKLLLA